MSTKKIFFSGKRLLGWIVLTAFSAGAQNYNLWIPQEKVSLLQGRTNSDKFRAEWSHYLTRADQLCDPLSVDYADPGNVTAGYDDKGHIIARRLIHWMETLGVAYRLTENPAYCEHGIRLLLSSAQMMTLDSIYMQASYAGARGDLMRGLAAGYDFFASALTVQQRTQVLQTAQEYLDDFIATALHASPGWRPYHNYMGVCGGASGLVALQLRDTDPVSADSALLQIISLIEEWLNNGFDAQGAYHEGVLYSVYGLENVVLFADILKQTGGKNLFENSALRNVMNFYVHSTLPGEKSQDARNDSLYDRNPGVCLFKLASEYTDGTAAWLYKPVQSVSSQKTWSPGTGFFLQLLWANDIQPVTPKSAGIPLAEYFQGRGLCSWRTGWTSDDVMFSVEAGKYYVVTHNQADKGHFTFYSHGYRWACDPGYANSNDPQGRAQTVAHNCVLIDGKGQARSGAGIGTTGRILTYTNSAFYGYALADCTDAYRRYYRYDSDRVTYPDGKPVEHMALDYAYRHTLFIRETDTTPAYAVVLDDINKDGAVHEYRWQMLSWPDLKIETDAATAVVSPLENNLTDLKMMVFLDADSDLAVISDICTPEDIKNPNLKPESFPRLNAICNAVNPYFAAVLIPIAGAVLPEVRFESVPDGKVIYVEWPEKTDRILWRTGISSPETAVQYFLPGVDDFNRDDSLMSSSGSVGPEWISSRATARWGIKNQTVAAETGEAVSVLYNTSVKTISGNGVGFSVNLDVTALQSNVWGGLAFNVQDADHFYWLRFKGGAGNYSIDRYVDGVSSRILASAVAGEFAINTAYTLTISSSNAFEYTYGIRDAVTGTDLASGTVLDGEASFTGGYAGLLQSTAGSERVRFDNFKAEIKKTQQIQPPGMDDFNRGNTSMSTDGGIIGDDWHSSRPDAKWGIADGQVVVNPTTGQSLLYNTALKTVSGNGSNFVARLDVTTLQSNVWGGLAFNVQDADNFYWLRFKGGAGNYSLHRCVNGVVSQIHASTVNGFFEVGKAYTLTVSSFKPFEFMYGINETVSGTVRVSGTAVDGACCFEGGYAALLQSSPGPDRFRFDNFSVECGSTSRSGFLFMLKGMP